MASMIVVTPLAALTETMETHRPTHLVSLLSATFMIETPAGIVGANHLRLCLSDVAQATAGLTHPAESHIAQLLAFGQGWDGAAPLVVHCWAGISRSMAAAYILLCARGKNGTEYTIAKKIRDRAAHANPNRLMVGLADRLLGRDGRMIDAIETMGRAQFVERGVPVEFPLDEMLR